MRSELVAVAYFAASAAAHGKVLSPPARPAGRAMVQACGQEAVDSINKDDTIPLEDVLNPSPSCNLFLCRGAQFEDNQDAVQKFTPGQTINFKADLSIPHEGPCNVSVVDTATNKIVGDPLITFDSYADEKLPQLPANNTNFDVTMPNVPAGQCTKPGECVLQWFWFGTDAKQTYESCVDFVVDPSSAKNKTRVTQTPNSRLRSDNTTQGFSGQDRPRQGQTGTVESEAAEEDC
ncbi:hypothetical protein HIM_08115 [Hirsutella minnesotensis 3608]|uniref:Chitin-binding type-4 domain-containing protein n=1 Tax=Hirsutella minnesotensis 3608 TaxID=1043627 RepID=A0A0F7ZHD4_9HYPO|nr:hypothetical protein HIM_08115 [Hirsutella minnesotensis 3608]